MFFFLFFGRGKPEYHRRETPFRAETREPANGWKSILCVCVGEGGGGVESKPDFVKWLEMNPVCAWHVGEGTVQTWLYQMPGNQAHVCAWHMGEDRVQTWFCLMAGDQSYVCVYDMLGKVWSKSDFVKWLEIKHMCVHGT